MKKVKVALAATILAALAVLVGVVIAINSQPTAPPSEDRVADIVEHKQRPGVVTLYMHEQGDNGVDA